MKGLGFNAREFTPRILMLCEVSLSSWRDLSKECHDCIGVMSRTYLANMGTGQEDVAVVQVRHDKSLGQVSGDGENGQIKKVLSRKSLQRLSGL